MDKHKYIILIAAGIVLVIVIILVSMLNSVSAPATSTEETPQPSPTQIPMPTLGSAGTGENVEITNFPQQLPDNGEGSEEFIPPQKQPGYELFTPAPED